MDINDNSKLYSALYEQEPQNVQDELKKIVGRLRDRDDERDMFIRDRRAYHKKHFVNTETKLAQKAAKFLHSIAYDVTFDATLKGVFKNNKVCFSGEEDMIAVHQAHGDLFKSSETPSLSGSVAVGGLTPTIDLELEYKVCRGGVIRPYSNVIYALTLCENDSLETKKMDLRGDVVLIGPDQKAKLTCTPKGSLDIKDTCDKIVYLTGFLKPDETHEGSTHCLYLKFRDVGQTIPRGGTC